MNFDQMVLGEALKQKGMARAAEAEGKAWRQRADLAIVHLASLGPVAKRFWAKVKPTQSCWLWTGAKHHWGYGLFGWTERVAHRVAWTLTFGKIPRGMQVLHRCDNPPCVHPDHLFLGTQADNVRDMWEKGRGNAGAAWHRIVRNLPQGSAHPNSKLNEAQVREIRHRSRKGENRTALSREFGVTWTVIEGIRNGTRWAWLK